MSRKVSKNQRIKDLENEIYGLRCSIAKQSITTDEPLIPGEHRCSGAKMNTYALKKELTRFDMKQVGDFEKATFEVVKWLRANGHPHMTVIIDLGHAECVEGVMAFPFELLD